MASKFMNTLAYTEKHPHYSVIDVRQAVACTACQHKQLMSGYIGTTEGFHNQQPDSAVTWAVPVISRAQQTTQLCICAGLAVAIREGIARGLHASSTAQTS